MGLRCSDVRWKTVPSSGCDKKCSVVDGDMGSMGSILDPIMKVVAIAAAASVPVFCWFDAKCVMCVFCVCVFQLNERSIHDSLVCIPHHITKSDFHALIFTVLSCLVSFHYLLDKTRQVTVFITVRMTITLQ